MTSSNSILRVLHTSLLLSPAFLGCVAPQTADEESAGSASPERVIPRSPQGAAGDTWSYPLAAKDSVVDDYHGTQVADPYRWLEEPDSPETRRWVAAENELTFGFLESLPGREALAARLEALWNYERYSLPVERGGRFFFRRNTGLQDQALLYVGKDDRDAGRLLLDPNDFSSDGTVALAEIAPSPDGKLLAYSVSDGGSDWRTWRFLNVDSGEHLPDVLTHNKFGGLEWMDGGAGVVYAQFDAPAEGDELHARNGSNDVCLHLMGTAEEDDIVLKEAPREGVWLWSKVTESGRALVVAINDTELDKNEVEVLSLVGPSRGRGVKIVSGFDAQYHFVGNRGDELWFSTTLDAPNGRVIAIDVFEPERERWRELIPERDVALESVAVVGGHLVLSYLRDAHSELRVHRTDGTLLREQELPGLGSSGAVEGQFGSPTAYFGYTSFTTPYEVWSLDVASGETRCIRKPQVDFDPDAFDVRQEFYTSNDGTRVPMFLVSKKGLARDGNAPTYLYGYGGFNISLTPVFSTKNLVWLERGGLLAIANLRGGGEYGEDWHKAGTKLQKQNVFDDFIAAAEWLIAEDYTRPARLAIAGGSNGGLLVGACMIQRPELFAAALPAVGVMDMLRYQHFTIGWAWARDYGTSDNADEFAALYAYSPLHNLSDGVAYPATLVTTGDHDDRVVPAHSYKFAARLQEASAGNAPALIRIETRAGHGAGKSTAMRIEEAVDELSFLDFALGIER